VPDTVCLLVDTSGSMIGLLEQVAPAVIYLNRAGITVRLIAGDTRVTLDEEVKGGKFPTLKGGGGTEITPLFTKAMEYDPRALVCFTDGYVQRWPDKMNLPMLWVSDYDGVPWGEQVKLKQEF
jgi:predicted metal-dependent peptidase